MLLKKSILKVAVVSLLLAAISGCSQLTRRETTQTPAGTKGFEEPRSSTPVDLAGPDRKVAVILGPGGYKTFAHTGVLKALAKRNIPVHAVVGVEWGALPAALFAQRGQVHEAEWKLYKLEKLNLENEDFFGRRKGPQRLNVLEAYARENLDVQRVEDTKLPFFCPVLNLRTGAVQLKAQGKLSQAVLECMGTPPLYRPYGSAAGLMAWREIVGELNRAGYDTIILVNVLGDGALLSKDIADKEDAAVLLWHEARRALWQAKTFVTDVIEVPTSGVTLNDFESRRLVTTAGERSGEKAARELADKYNF